MPATIDSAQREDPLAGFQFRLDLSGAVAGYFTGCDGLGSETEVAEHKVISEKGVEVVMKVPGRLKWGDITLKRGITSDLMLWDWRRQVEEGKVTDARKDGSIIMFDSRLEEKARWNFNNAWPSKISGPALKADANELVVEELTIVHEYIARVKV
jgi:phage tail-like protein